MIGIGSLFQKQKEPSPQPQNEAKKKVLIIEDEPHISAIYREVLTANGFGTFIAANGEEGLRKIVEISPDLILLDLRMPVMSGKAMLSHLKNDAEYANYKNIPVVILTNSGKSDNIRDTVRLGEAADFIIKSSVTPDQVAEIVRKYI